MKRAFPHFPLRGGPDRTGLDLDGIWRPADQLATGTRGGKDLPPYMFTCPAVQPQFSRLLRRHLGFLVGLFALQTLALAQRPHLPDWWNIESGHGRGRGTPFDIVLLFLCIGLGYTQVFTNRSLLDRAHREFNS